VKILAAVVLCAWSDPASACGGDGKNLRAAPRVRDPQPHRAMPARATALAVLATLLIVHGAGGAAPAEDYTVLGELSSDIAIRNLTLALPPRSSHVACQGDALVLVRAAGDERHRPQDALEVAFVVADLVMGPGAGRAVVMIDDEAVAECPAQHCRVRLPARRWLAPPSSHRDACAGGSTSACAASGALRAGGSKDLPSPSAVQISLMAPEADLPTQPVVLGVQRSFSIALIDLHPDDSAPETEAQLGALTGNTNSYAHKLMRVRPGDVIPADYCAAAQGAAQDGHQGAEKAASEASASHGVLGGGGGEHALGEEAQAGREVRREASEGESSEAQHLFMRHLVRSYPEVRQVLEIGFHAGLSARAFLSARADLRMVSFDIGRHGHELLAWRALAETYPSRHTLVLADSLAGVPAFHRHNPARSFDLFYIDGGHTYRHAISDIRNCHQLSRPSAQPSPSASPQAGGGDGAGGVAGALVLIDDLTPWVYWGVGPDKVL